MKFKSPLLSQASGSVAGLTFSHNKGGMYLRQRVIPINPGTPRQQAVRGILANMSNVWLTSMTAAQRQAWKDYADAVPFTDRLGESRILPPLAMFIRSLSARTVYEATAYGNYDAPTIFDLGQLTAPSISASAATNQISVSFNANDEWVTESTGVLGYAFSRQQDPTINYWKGPYRYYGRTLGNAGAPPAPPALVTYDGTLVAGLKIFGQFRCLRADNRLTAPFRVECTCGA